MSEAQSDKENNSNKASSVDVLTPLISGSGTTGYDSDSLKPVKVKSRWRRSSELEMGGSSGISSRLTLGFANSPAIGVGSGVASSPIESVTKATVSPLGSHDFKDASSYKDPNTSKNSEILETSWTANSITANATLTTSKAVGAKMFLPMVPEVADREMEERLSQFEHLKENLYLTDR